MLPSSPEELLAHAPEDPLVRAQLRSTPSAGWRADGAIVLRRTGSSGRLRLLGLGEPAAVGAMLGPIMAETANANRPPPRAVVTRGATAHLPSWLRVEDPDDWDWRAITTPPPPWPNEDRVEWLGPGDADDLAALLHAANPISSVWPGDARVHRWVGIRACSGELVACLADTSGSLTDISGVAVSPEARRHGLGSAITAWASRRLFDEGRELVSLGIYAGNAAGHRIYDRLGFSNEHPLTGCTLTTER